MYYKGSWVLRKKKTKQLYLLEQDIEIWEWAFLKGQSPKASHGWVIFMGKKCVCVCVLVVDAHMGWEVVWVSLNFFQLDSSTWAGSSCGSKINISHGAAPGGGWATQSQLVLVSSNFKSLKVLGDWLVVFSIQNPCRGNHTRALGSGRAGTRPLPLLLLTVRLESQLPHWSHGDASFIGLL